MKLSPGNNYTVRLLPNVKDPTKTFFHYYSVGWTSFATGQYISYVSPSTFGERDPLLEAKYRILRSDSSDDELRKKAESVLRSEKWLVSAYVVKDPTNPEGEGKVSIIRYGKQLHKIIMDAIEGEGSEDYGSRIFDLSSNGCNFVIKVEKQGDYPTYVSSKFTMPKAVEGLNEDKIDTIYNSSFDLTSVLPTKSFEEIEALLNEHFYCKEATQEAETTYTRPSTQTSAVVSTNTTASKPSVNTTTDDDIIDESKVEELLKGLENI
jgi:hypothetical protein